METVRLALRAMATRFELVLHGENAVHLRAAGETAFSEISRLEAQLSFYRPTSDISRINATAAQQPVRVEPRLFELLLAAKQLYLQTDGAFDITIGPLMRCWGFVNGSGHFPPADVLAEARRQTGMHLVHLDPSKRTIAFERPGVQVDLGGIGKGYAIDEAIVSLREDGVTSALMHGGTSTIYALGQPPEDSRWKTAIPAPSASSGDSVNEDILAIVELHDESLSVSAPSGKSFVNEGTEYGHVIDPRSGYPVAGASLTAVVASSSMVSDALATALLVEGFEAADSIVDSMADAYSVRLLAASHGNDASPFQVHQKGIPLFSPRVHSREN